MKCCFNDISFSLSHTHQEAFVELYSRQRESVFRSSWSSIVTVFGLAALGAVGLTIGAYLAQKWGTFPSFTRLPLLPSVNPLLCFPQKTSMSQDCSSSKLFSHSLQVFLLCLQTQRQKRQEMNALPTHHERMAEKLNNEVKQTLADVSLAELVQNSKWVMSVAHIRY